MHVGELSGVAIKSRHPGNSQGGTNDEKRRSGGSAGGTEELQRISLVGSVFCYVVRVFFLSHKF